jgi:TonB family protein
VVNRICRSTTSRRRNAAQTIKPSGNTEEKVFTFVEESPEFRGGQGALMGFLSANICYPTLARNKGIEGKVYLSFVVSKIGFTENIKVLRGIGGGCDEEAVRVVSNMPQWKPGKQNGQAVRVQYTLPIQFKLY